jgi:biotin carboxyl carrier protein
MTRAVVRVVAVGACALGLLCAGVQLVFIVVTVSHVSSGNAMLGLLDTVADALSLGTADLFTPVDKTTRVAVNAGAAALIWMLSSGAVAVPVTRMATASRGRTCDQNRAPDRASEPPSPGLTESGDRTALKVSRILITTVAVVAVMETVGFCGTYLLYSRHYVYTDNANVDGDKIDINAPTSGTVVGWSINEGTTVRTDQIVGRVQGVGSGGQPQDPIKAPDAGTVAVTNVVNGSYVDAGAELATAYDFTKIYVTARVDDYDLGDVHPGAPADITVAEFPDAAITGIVDVVQNSAAGNFTIYPPAGTADPSNPQRVDQYIPVKIEFTNTAGVRLVPGMNVSVHIHKH